MSAIVLGTGREAGGVRVLHHQVCLRTTGRLQFVDVTDLVAERVRRSGIRQGLVNVQTTHTTAAVVVNENEPLLLQDLEDLLVRWAPEDGRYRHDRFDRRDPPPPPDERTNGHAHARALALPTAVTLNVAGGRPVLGRWQSLFLVELDGGQARTLSILILGTAEPA